MGELLQLWPTSPMLPEGLVLRDARVKQRFALNRKNFPTFISALIFM
jgi:hypothetical protein